jgi:hypothetical protein
MRKRNAVRLKFGQGIIDLQENLPASVKYPSHHRDYGNHDHCAKGTNNQRRVASLLLELVNFVSEDIPAIGTSKAIQKHL